jgi:hypothetical protein
LTGDRGGVAATGVGACSLEPLEDSSLLSSYSLSELEDDMAKESVRGMWRRERIETQDGRKK